MILINNTQITEPLLIILRYILTKNSYFVKKKEYISEYTITLQKFGVKKINK